MTADLRPYPEYKDSGLPWLGRVPSHWDIVRTKALFRLSIEKSAVQHGMELLSIYTHIGVKPRKDLEERGNKASNTDGYWIVRKGDLIVNKLLAWMGAVGVSHYDGVTSPAYDILRPRRLLNSDFYHYVFRTGTYLQQFKSRSRGIMDMRLRLYFDQLGQIPAIEPPQNEQDAVVAYLDSVFRRTNKFIRNRRRLIEVLNEQKQAIINRAVTRGLDPNVRLKPSGIEWLGDIPGRWNIAQLKRLVQRNRKITYGIVQPGHYDSSGTYMVRGQDYSSGWARPPSLFRVSHEIEEPYRRSRLHSGDLVMTIVGAGVGNVAIVPDWLDGANITQTTARIAVDPNLADPRYVASVLTSSIGHTNVDLYVKGAAQPGLNLEHVRIFQLPLPPMHEQTVIADHLDSRLATVKNVILQVQREIDLIREYRTRLIADVVTGKVNVRHLAPAPGDEPVEPEELAEDIEDDEVQPDDEPELAEETADE